MAAMGDITKFATCASFWILWDSQKNVEGKWFPKKLQKD